MGEGGKLLRERRLRHGGSSGAGHPPQWSSAAKRGTRFGIGSCPYAAAVGRELTGNPEGMRKWQQLLTECFRGGSKPFSSERKRKWANSAANSLFKQLAPALTFSFFLGLLKAFRKSREPGKGQEAGFEGRRDARAGGVSSLSGTSQKVNGEKYEPENEERGRYF